MLLDIPDIITFFGRFHPLVVHLPIGILLLAAIIALVSRKEKYKTPAPVLDFMLLLGAISAVLACALGYLLSWGGDYNPDSLFWHQWSGITLAVLSSALYWLRTSGLNQRIRFLKKNSHWAFGILLALIIVTGHFGGTLTHGSDYLFQYAPDPLRAIAGLGPKPIPRPPVTVLDSADIFLDVVHPLLRSKCQSCHNPDKIKGELSLSNYQELLKGGKSGPSIVPGDPEKSELYQRITLPEDHEDFMPAEGKPGLDDDELALVRWWIEKGAPSTMLLAGMEMESDMTARFQRVLGLGTSESRLPGTEIAAADTAGIRLAREQGFTVERIAPGSNFLEVQLPYTVQRKENRDMKALLAIKDQVAWMDLSKAEVTDEDLAVVGQLKSLSRLNLANNPLSDKGIAHLGDLKELRSLNLYGTSVTDQSLSALKSLQKLRSVYLWQTKVTGTGVESFIAERPDIAVSLGYQELQTATEPDTSQRIN